MSEPVPAIVVSLPARSVSEAIVEIAEARAAGADAAELRLDRWSREERARLPEIFPAPLPLLATFRSSREGGEGPDDPDERARELGRFAEMPFRWIDLEFARDLGLEPRLPPEERIGRIVSLHLQGSEFGEWTHRLIELSDVHGLGKLVVPASVPVALREIVPHLLARRDEPVVVLTTGPSGPILRALSRRLGAPLVFAALPEGRGKEAVEPSQIPVDRLRGFLAADGEPPLFAVAGRPVAHSLSPAVHSSWMRADGRAGLYVPLEFADDDEFLEALPLLASNGFRGLNVTHPFKAAAFEGASEAGPGAKSCRAANCLTLRDGEVVAENTDLVAILRRLEELRASGDWDGRMLAVLGAGGAARATLAAARLLSADATIFARRPGAADALAKEFGATVGRPAEGTRASLVVHATAVGRRGAQPLDLALRSVLAASTHVLDWVYRPEDPVVRDAARSAGATYEDGWRLFVYQAAASYSVWWGEELSPERISATIAEGGCAA
jgi:shikimate dehydrogenase/3-dehydroquinate dehydratase type I